MHQRHFSHFVLKNSLLNPEMKVPFIIIYKELSPNLHILELEAVPWLTIIFLVLVVSFNANVKVSVCMVL